MVDARTSLGSALGAARRESEYAVAPRNYYEGCLMMLNAAWNRLSAATTERDAEVRERIDTSLQ